jgi:hypothetical protein
MPVLHPVGLVAASSGNLAGCGDQCAQATG